MKKEGKSDSGGIGCIFLIGLIGTYFGIDFFKPSTYIVILVIAFTILFLFLLNRFFSRRAIENQRKKPHSINKIDIKKELSKINNELNKGVSIIGGAGSGKTFSLIVPLISTFYNNEYKRGILFDYKYPELTNEFKKIGFDIIIFNPIDYKNSICINPFDFCEDYSDFVKNWTDFYKNSRKSEKIGFFELESINLLSAVSYSLKKKGFATLRNITSAITLDNEVLLSLLKSSGDLDLTAKKFEESMKSDNQFSGVIASVIQVLEPICNENVFKITDKTDKDVFKIPLSIGANQSKISVYTPLLAMVFNSFIEVVQNDENVEKTFVLIDEAPMFIISNFSNYPATLRSKLVAIVCAIQDVSQFVKNYGQEETRSIIANLHFKFFGKIGEPTTVKFVQDLIGTRNHIKRSKIDWKNNNEHTYTESENLIASKWFTDLVAGDFWSNIKGSFNMYKLRVKEEKTVQGPEKNII